MTEASHSSHTTHAHPAALTVIKPGALTLLQDACRVGVMHQGLASGGPMDRHAWAWANHLLGNRYGSAALEITFGNFTARCESDSYVCLSGAEVEWMVNGQPQPRWAPVAVKAGDELAIATPSAGIRNYLAIAGGFNAPKNLGHSCATLVREGTGGLHENGQPLAAGDRLAGGRAVLSKAKGYMPQKFVPDYRQSVALDIILCAQQDAFDDEQINRLLNFPFTLSPHSDRMGARLEGPAIGCRQQNLISEAIPFGAVQIPPDGQPIILLADRQTIGGYPKVGAVTPRSLDALAQAMPGSQVRFNRVTLQQAQLEERKFLAFFSGTSGPQS